VLVLYILNRFTCSKENFMGLGNTLSSRSENEYRRVKLKYGRQKLKRMGLDPAKYSEDFIFALKITLEEVNVDIEATATLCNDNYKLSLSGSDTNNQHHMVDLQINRNYDLLKPTSTGNYNLSAYKMGEDAGFDTSDLTKEKKGSLFLDVKTASISLKKLLVLIRYKALADSSAATDPTQRATAMKSFFDAAILYANKTKVLFICMWKPAATAQEVSGKLSEVFSSISDFPLIHGFSSTCQAKKNPTAGVVGEIPSKHTNSSCLDAGDAKTYQTIVDSLTATPPMDDAGSLENPSSTKYMGGRKYIKKYQHIFKTDYTVPSGVSTSSQGVSTSSQLVKGKIDPTSFNRGGEYSATPPTTPTTDNPQPELTAENHLYNRINAMFKITNPIENPTAAPTTLAIQPEEVGYFLAEINIEAMSNLFAIYNTDVVFELISQG
jgi:hypothetical protein